MFKRVNGRIFNIVSVGSGEPPLLLIGGWIGSWQLWRQPMELLSAHRRCVAYDHRGAGQTIAATQDLHPEGLVDDVFLLLDALGIDRCWLAGESQGGIIAVMAAVRAPSRFLGLTLIATAPAFAQTAEHDQFAAALERNPDSVLRRFVDLCIPEADSGHLKRWLLHILKEAEPGAGVSLVRQMYRADIRNQLAAVSLPTQIIHGEADRIETPAGAATLARGIRNAELLLLPGVGHVPTITCPEIVAQAMASFMARHQA